MTTGIVVPNDQIADLEDLLSTLRTVSDQSIQRRIRALFRAKIIAVLRREALPAMKITTPVRTGVGKRSVRIVNSRRPYGIQFGAGRKGFYLQFHDGLIAEWRRIVTDVYNRNAPRLLREAITEVVQSLDRDRADILSLDNLVESVNFDIGG